MINIKTLKIICISLTLTCLILWGFVFTKCSDKENPKNKIDRTLLIGNWLDSEPVQLKLNADSTFKIYISGSEQDFYGIWTTTETFVNYDTTTFLILFNTKEQEYENEEYFKYYFLRVDQVEEGKLKLMDLSRKLKLNCQYNFKKES